MIFLDLGAAENIFISHKDRGRALRWGQMYAEAEAILAKLDINPDVRSQARGLTLASQQAVEIAKAISFNVRVLIIAQVDFDETGVVMADYAAWTADDAVYAPVSTAA